MDIILKLVGYTRSRHNLTFLYQYHEITFTTTLWYSTVDFHQLEEEYGQEYMGKLYFHILLFHGLKILSLKPTHLDLGEYAKYWSPQLQKVWERSVEQCLGQWRYESGNIDYSGVEVIAKDVPELKIEPIKLNAQDPPLLVCNGGGKDSVLMIRLLDERAISFDTFSINFHTHAYPEKMFELNEKHLDYLDHPPQKNHRQYIIESFLNSPAAKLHGVEDLEISLMHNDEDLPNAYGVFGILPIILQEKYTSICFGNERSAESENVQVNEQIINHAWSKTTECEILYQQYVQKEFIANLSIFSFLKPFSDVLVYRLLAKKVNPISLALAYSCNLNPPWCKLCPKCAYVWLSYMAYLAPEQVKAIVEVFGEENLFDCSDLQFYYRGLMGLESHKPFECVGEIEESKLAFEKCVERGVTGKAVDSYLQKARLDKDEYKKLWEKYNQIDLSYQYLPQQFQALLVKEYQNLE